MTTAKPIVPRNKRLLEDVTRRRLERSGIPLALDEVWLRHIPVSHVHNGVWTFELPKEEFTRWVFENDAPLLWQAVPFVDDDARDLRLDA